MVAGLLVCLYGLGGTVAECAEVPRVAVLCTAYRDEYDQDLARLGWRTEKLENAQLTALTERLDQYDFVIGPTAYRLEPPEDLRSCADRLRQFIRYGGILLLTDATSEAQVSWLAAVEPGLSLDLRGEPCVSDREPLAWVDVRHPLLAGVGPLPGVSTHPTAASGLWQVLARCEHGRPVLLYREIGDGLVVVSCLGRQSGFPDGTFLQNLWLWARDDGRIKAARDREEARYQALIRPKELDAERIDPPPVIDGIVEEEAWNKAGRTEQFVRVDGTSVAEQETVAFLALDDYYVYAAFRCTDSDPRGLVTEATQRDGPVEQDDCVELLVDPTGRRETCRRFVVNAGGVLYDAAGADSTWDGWWQAAVQRNPRGWSVEMRIPLLMLGDIGSFADEWAVNCGRRYPRTGEVSAWSPTLGPLDTPARFGTVKGANVDPGRFPLRLNRIGLEGSTLSVSLLNPSHGDLRGRYIVECLSPSGKLKQTTREITVREYDSTLVETEHRLDEPGTWVLGARVEVDGGPVWVSDPLAVETSVRPGG